MSDELVYTAVNDIPKVRDHLRSSFRAGKAKSVAFRKEQLLQLAYLFQDNAELFQATLKKDLGRPIAETNMLDLSSIIAQTIYAYKNVGSWVKPEGGPFDINWFPFSPKVYKEPKGTVLIIGAFNYPLWCLGPVTGAIAAGCAAVIKPSELTPATSQLLAELFPKYMDPDLYRIVNGAVEETTKLLSLQWDHILYTGSARVGRIVAMAAAKHLTPVTLELGGKSPVIVDSNADFELAAKRILWAKMANSGQTCIAPDYVLVPQTAQEKLVSALKTEWKKFYGVDPQTSESFSRICAPSHWERIANLLGETKGDIILGGQTDRSDKYIAPTLVNNVPFNDSLMKEEIFGPILPIIPVGNVGEALEYINDNDHPLVAYVFSKDAKLRAHVRENSTSGMFFENDLMLLGGSTVTPFGGVGASGYGAHGGRYSFETFTHRRTSLSSPKWIDIILGVRYPPYTAKSVKGINAALMPRIPYPRPGESRSFGWKRWVMYTRR